MEETFRLGTYIGYKEPPYPEFSGIDYTKEVARLRKEAINEYLGWFKHNEVELLNYTLDANSLCIVTIYRRDLPLVKLMFPDLKLLERQS